MKNRNFTRKTAEEKRHHLTAILRHTSGGALDDAMIGRILPSVAIHRQYKVTALTDGQAFRDVLGRNVKGAVLMSSGSAQNGQQTVAAVITPRESADRKNGDRAIYIYAPDPALLKEMKS